MDHISVPAVAAVASVGGEQLRDAHANLVGKAKALRLQQVECQNLSL